MTSQITVLYPQVLFFKQASQRFLELFVYLIRAAFCESAAMPLQQGHVRRGNRVLDCAHQSIKAGGDTVLWLAKTRTTRLSRFHLKLVKNPEKNCCDETA